MKCSAVVTSIDNLSEFSGNLVKVTSQSATTGEWQTLWSGDQDTEIDSGT